MRAKPRRIIVDKLKLLLVRRFLVGVIKSRREFAAADNEKGALRAGGDGSLTNKASVENGDRQKDNKTDEKHTTARLHRFIKRRRRIEQQSTHGRRRRDREN